MAKPSTKPCKDAAKAQNDEPTPSQASGIAVFCAYDKLADVTTLVPNPRNPNTHPDKQIALLAKIIRAQGWRSPIVVSKRSGFIVKGHGRLQAAKVLNVEMVPVDYQDYESEAVEWADMIADNKLAELAETDDAILTGLLKELETMDIDIELTGMFDRDVKKQTLSDSGKDAEPQIDKADELRVKWGVELGQVWELSDHRLMCGDSTKAEDIGRLMENEKADMVFTDPPYNHASENKGIASEVSKAHKDLMASDWDKNFSFASVELGLELMMGKNCTVYICTSWHLAGDIWKWMSKHSSCSGYCVWSKPNPMPSLMKRHWTWASELICYATYGKHTFNFPHDGHALNVWTITKHSDGSHPTQKPVELVSHAVVHSSNAGDIVSDLFLGSGTTLIACENLHRKCRAMEISPGYVAVAIQRWVDATGKEPKLISK